MSASNEKESRSERVALTTGQAAEYCFVSPGTIQNWIKRGRLAGQRTAGGQFRIRLDQLREFMLANDMSVDALDHDYCLSRLCFCWEYFSRSADHTDREEGCEDCIVRKSRSLNCFELRGHVDHREVHCATDCADCPFYQAYASGRDEADTSPKKGAHHS